MSNQSGEREQVDTVVIGAGQTGLALGYHLQKTPLRFLLVEHYDRIGASWRERYDSLVLFNPTRL